MSSTLESAATKNRLGNVQAVAEMLGVSCEHVRRLNDRGAMPKAIRLGRSIRWDLNAVESWIAESCPDFSKQRGRR